MKERSIPVDQARYATSGMERSFIYEILIDINQCADPRKFTWNYFPRVFTNHFPRASNIYQ